MEHALIVADLSRRSRAEIKVPPSFSGNFGEAKAEREGFEPSIPCGIPPFQGGALGHYATSPEGRGSSRFLQSRVLMRPLQAPIVPSKRGRSQLEDITDKPDYC
jgi:hypothetical protein